MNVHFSKHRLWQLWTRDSVVPQRPVGWEPAEKAFFYFENEKREPEVLEVWAAPVVNGKPELGAWTYDVKACTLVIKGRNLSLTNAEIQEGWPSDEKPQLTAPSVKPTVIIESARNAPEVRPVGCPLCALLVTPIAWRGNLCFPPHNAPDDNDCAMSYKPLQELPPGNRGRFEGFEKLMELVPQTYGEALSLYPFLEKIPGHEWDNRTTSENAAWLIRELLPRAFPVDRAPTAKERRRRGRS